MKYYIIAGEASGDLHGSKLIEGILASDPGAEIRFWGGEKMAAAYPGGLVMDYRSTAVMGYVEVIKSLGKILGRMAFCKRDISEFQPDVVIFIDYPGFNLKMAKWAHNQGFKTVYYIAPKVWASREGRLAALKKYLDRVIIIFPFEVPYFEEKGLAVDYVGCPLVEIIAERVGTSGALNKTRTIALLAGSRTAEIKTMLGPLQDMAAKIHAQPGYEDYRFVIAAAPGRRAEDYPIRAELRDIIDIEWGKTYEVLAHADAAVVNSGTASLETLIIGTPQVVGYILPSNITYAIGRLIIKVKFISLGNLCANKLIFKELIQKECNGEALYEEVMRLLSDKAYREAMLEGYGEVMEMLHPSSTQSGPAAAAAADQTLADSPAMKAGRICHNVALQ